MHLARADKKTAILMCKTQTNGDKNLNNIDGYIRLNNNTHTSPMTLRRVLLLDQEPFVSDYYFIDQDHQRPIVEYNFNELSFLEKIATRFSITSPSIITISDYNNKLIENFDTKYLIPCYFWFHGLISLRWFYNWKYYERDQLENTKKFGLYARSVNGNRTYRAQLLEDLASYSKDIYFYLQPSTKKDLPSHVVNSWPENKKIFNSETSATIDWEDHSKFDIQLVAETVFNDESFVHLTEKVFKPIVMYQPFILFANAGSLKYLRKYGFKTFDSVWDESYDLELDSKERYQKIINLTYQLSSLSSTEFKKIIEKTQEIVNYNRKHFFSQEFETILYSETKHNFQEALSIQYDYMFSNPGGLWFEKVSRYVLTHPNSQLPESVKDLIKHTVLSLKIIDQSLADNVIKTYNHLF